MPAGVAFADILDEKLGGVTAFTPPPAPPARPRFVPPHPLLYAAPHRRSRVTAYGSTPVDRAHTAPAVAAPRPVGAQSAPSTPPPATRSLSGRERAAFDALTMLGARLGPDFTAAELRRAFRALARRCHPDRHPHAGVEEQARLARLFAGLHEHYRVLARLTA